MGQIFRYASHEVTISLIETKFSPLLVFGTATCHVSVRDITSLEYPITCALFKLFNTKTNHLKLLENYKLAFGLRPFTLTIAIRKINFYNNFSTTFYALCRRIAASSLLSD